MQTNADFSNLTLMLRDGTQMTCKDSVWRNRSRYFQALLETGAFAEAQTRQISLLHVDARAVRSIYAYFLDHKTADEFFVWDGFEGWPSADSKALVEAIDYLQIVGDTSPHSKDVEAISYIEATIQAIIVMDDSSIVHRQCMEQGLVDRETGRVLKIPLGKKKRESRFWVCYALCLEIMGDPEERVDQSTLTSMLSRVSFEGGSVVLRRELVEYGLIEREGDGSAYWRPAHSIVRHREWIRCMPTRRVI